MSHHFQILSLCERKNLRDLCRESNPGPLNYMSRARYLCHWIRDLDLASSFLKQPKMRDLGVHFPKFFRGTSPGPPFFSRPLATSPQPPPHLKTSSYASVLVKSTSGFFSFHCTPLLRLFSGALLLDLSLFILRCSKERVVYLSI